MPVKAREYRIACGRGGELVDPYVVEAIKSGALPPKAEPLLSGFRHGDVISTPMLAKKAAENSPKRLSYAYRMKTALDVVRTAEGAGLLVNIDHKPPVSLDEFSRIPPVEYWLKTLNDTNFQHSTSHGRFTGTRRSYASRLYKFHGWLAGRTVAITRRHYTASGIRTTTRQALLGGVNDLLDLYLEPDADARELNKVAKEYLSEIRDAGHLSFSSIKNTESAFKSFFEAHEVSYSIKLSVRKIRGGRGVAPAGAAGASEDWVDNTLTLGDFATIMSAGQPSLLDKSVFLSMFHRGLDRATLADRFNYTAFDQVSAHMGSDDTNNWDLAKCPVPIVLERVKTGYRHTGFLERDAVSAMRDWLHDRERRMGSQLHRGDGEPLYVTIHGNPIRDYWVDHRFAKLALRAGLVKKSSTGGDSPSRRSHQLRKLIKSTLIDAGCRMDVADHVIGHAPKDVYEVQASLYPDSLRREYAKAAGRINVFTRIMSAIDSGYSGVGGQDALQARLDEMSTRIDNMADELHRRNQQDGIDIETVQMLRAENRMLRARIARMGARAGAAEPGPDEAEPGAGAPH